MEYTMTTINTGSSVSSQTPLQPGADDAGTDDSLQARKADGLPGLLGLLEVHVNGETRFVTADELAHLQGGAGGGGPGTSGHTSGAHRDAGSPGLAVLRHELGHAHALHTDGSKGSAPSKFATDVKWAEDFRKNADDKLKRAGIPADERKRITDHLGTLSGAALVKETRLLDHVLKTPNADRALNTYDELLTLSKQSGRATERLTPAMREELVRGVADRRTSTDKGLEGVLGKREALESARALIAMPKAEYDRLQSALDHAGQKRDGSPARGADAHTERALILKAVGARADRLKETPLDVAAQKRGVCVDTPAGRAMGEIIGFAGEVRGMKREDLIHNTTTLAINRVDRGPDVDNLPAGNTRRHVGLYQRYDAACGPTTAQNMQAERDPVFALKLRKDFNNPGNDSDLARQQKGVLEKTRFYDAAGNVVNATPAQVAKWAKDGTMPPGATQFVTPTAYNRLGGQAEKRLAAQLGNAWSLTHIPADQRNAALKYMRNQQTTPAEAVLAKKAFDKIAKVDGGHPTATELDAMRSNYTRNPSGTSTKKLEHTWMYLPEALSDIAPPAAGKTWQANVTNGGTARGMSNADITKLDTTLKAGTDVPIRICNAGGGGGHFMMISDVRGEGANKKYLISDPWTGKTAWVKQSELQNFNSNWPQTYFSKDLANGVSHVYYEQ